MSNILLSMIEKRLSIDLLKYQEEFIINSMNKKRTVLCTGRGVGKSYAVALASLVLTEAEPGVRIAIFAPSLRMTKFVLTFIEELGTKFKFSRQFSRQNDLFLFENGSTITGIPISGDRAEIRKRLVPNSIEYDYYFCEETLYFMEEVLEDITNILAYRNASYIMTPRPNKVYYDWFKTLSRNGSLIRANVFSVITELPIDLEYIIERMNDLPKDDCVCEILGYFPQELKCPTTIIIPTGGLVC